MNFDTDSWIQFIQENWVMIAVALVAIIVIMKLVKTLLKWVLIGAIVIAIVTYGGYSVEDIKSKMSDELGNLGGKVTAEMREQAIKAMIGEANEAVYKDQADGSYTITSTNLEVSGFPNTGKVAVKYRGAPLGSWELEGALRDLVVQSRSASK